MNRFLLFLPLLWASLLPAEDAAPPAPISLAVLPFESSDPAMQSKATEAATLLAAQLSTNTDLWMVERADLDKILAEQTLKLSGLTDPSTAVQVGKIIGARALVTGRLIRSGNSVLLVAKIMSTETSRVFGETATAASADTLEKPVAELSGKIGKLLSTQRAVFNPPVERREDRIAKLREALKNKPLPTVQIGITERSLRSANVDPAVETELGKIIKELGGEVVDATQSGKPGEIMLSGEAFSETGARHGQLVSARARVEIKATRRSDSKLLAVDRETGVAVDISDSVAGKTALQNAAFTIAERLLPKLVAP